MTLMFQGPLKSKNSGSKKIVTFVIHFPKFGIFATEIVL